MGIENLVQDLNEEIRRCNKCRLAESRMNVVCGEGNLHGKIMLIAQAPGENEDREGRMFIGPSGKVLDELLTTADIDRKEVYMTNLIKCTLPKNRRPKSDEIEICSHYLDREIELIRPRILALLGHYPTKYIFEKRGIVLPSKAEFHKVYGNVLEAGDREIIPLQHPAALLHNTSIKEAMGRNYRKLKALLTSLLAEEDDWAQEMRRKQREI